MQDNQQMKTTPNLLRNNVSKTNFTYKNKQNNFFNEITDKNITICRRFHKVYILFNLKQNWPTYSDFCVNWEHIFTSFSLRYRWAILHQNHKKLLAGDREGFSLPYFSLIYSYLPVINPSSPAGGEGFFLSNSNILHPQPR